jgi:hypothetical protein
MRYLLVQRLLTRNGFGSGFLRHMYPGRLALRLSC